MLPTPRVRLMKNDAETSNALPSSSHLPGLSTVSFAYITPAEWRWVVIMSCLLVLLAVTPLMLMVLIGISGWQFMGVLHNYLDGATYFAKMSLGQNGDWLVSFLHTPEAHSGAFIQVLYLLLGHVSRLTGIPTAVIFHLARILAALLMYAAIYQLGATIWSRVRPRRLFFGVAAIGAGLGWLFAPLTGELIYVDFPLLPEAFPFFSSLMNVHFPLAIALLCILASALIVVFRPGSEDNPSLKSAWPVASVLSLLLGFLYPQALVPFAGTLVVFTLSLFRARQARMIIWYWVLAVIVPVIPLALYYWMVVTYNPVMAIWNQQNQTPAPSLHGLVLGLGLPLLVGLPAIWRAVRRFERDGDRFMLIWLALMIAAMYLPTNVQRRFAVGLMIPVAYFAVRAIEDTWIHLIQRRWRLLVGIAFFFLISISTVLMLFLPVIPVAVGNPGRAVGVYLEADYGPIFNELNQRATLNDVVLASPVVSVWLPGWGGVRSVYGHPYETVDAEERRAEVEAWFAADSPEHCLDLLERYSVRYVIFGPEEARLGAGTCLSVLREIGRAGSVAIYAR